MMSATYFGEITELDSRAVWYSDEEDEDEDEEQDVLSTKFHTQSNILPKSIELITHDTIRSKIQASLALVSETLPMKIATCIISLSSKTHLSSIKTTGQLIATFGTIGKAIAFPVGQQVLPSVADANDHSLWLVFDSNHPYIVGQEVGYFAEHLRELLQSDFKLDHTSSIIILSSQFSSSEYLEYLNNSINQLVKLPFVGRPLLPPSIIKNHFESALFEQLSLSHRPALLACLPDPKSYWFDQTKQWPSIPGDIIEHKLKDDNLEKTLIFT